MWLRRSSCLLLLLVTACSPQSPANKVTTHLQTIRSWQATAHMVGDAWLRGDVPTAYAEQTLHTAGQELGKAADELAQVPLPEPQRTTLNIQLGHPDRTLEALATAVEHNDRNALAQLLEQLAHDEQALGNLQQTAGAQQ